MAARGLEHVNPKAGSFVLVGLLTAVVGVFLAGRAQGWFEPHLDVQTEPLWLPPDSTLGIEPGADVEVLGSTVGSVIDVALDSPASSQPSANVPVHFTLRLRGPLMKLVRENSVVQVRRKFGVAGSAYLLVTAGKGPAATPQTRLACVVAPDITTTIEETMRNLNRPDGPVQQILANTQKVTADLATGQGAIGQVLHDPAMAQSIQATLANIQALSQSLKQSESPVGKLLNDPKTGEALAGTITAVRASMESVDKMLARAQEANVQEFMQQLKQTLAQVENTLKEVSLATATLRTQSKDLPALVAQMQEMMRQTTRLIEGMQKTWLLRDHVTPEGSYKLSPVDVVRP